MASAYAVLLQSDPIDVHSGSRAQWSLHRGVEVGWAAFECHLVLTSCASETRGENVSVGALQRGVEVGWRGFKWLRCVLRTARSRNCSVKAGVEPHGDFIEALKWAGRRSSATWCSHPVQARLEAQKSARGHFIEAMKWAGARSSGKCVRISAPERSNRCPQRESSAMVTSSRR